MLDGRSDFYAAGACLYELLTGRPPFAAAGAMEVLALHVTAMPPHLDGMPALDAIVQRCLAKQPVQRFADAHALMNALGNVSGHVSTTMRAPGSRRAEPRRCRAR